MQGKKKDPGVIIAAYPRPEPHRGAGGTSEKGGKTWQ